jgi:hypothetical protein
MKELWRTVPQNVLVQAIITSSDETREELAENVNSFV